MNDFIKYIEKYTVRNGNVIKRIAAPFTETFGIDHIHYHRVNYDGTGYIFSYPADICLFYHSLPDHGNSPFYTNPANIIEGFCWWNRQDFKPMKETMRYLKREFAIQKIPTYIFKDEEGYDHFNWTYPEDNTYADELLLEDFSLVKKFFKYYKTSLYEHFPEIRYDLIDIKSLCGDHFDVKYQYQVGVGNRQRLEFLKKLGVQESLRIFDHLSSREWECVDFYRAGYSACQTGKILGLSPRTIESYFENIKSKLGLSKKNEIIQLLHSMGC